MGDDNIDTVISHIDMGHLVTLLILLLSCHEMPGNPRNEGWENACQ